MIHDKLHSLHHQLLRRISQMARAPDSAATCKSVQPDRSSPDKHSNRNNKANRPTRSRILLRRLQHTQVNPHGTRYKIRVRISPVRRYTGQVLIHDPQRIHFNIFTCSVQARISLRPLSTITICISCPSTVSCNGGIRR